MLLHEAAPVATSARKAALTYLKGYMQACIHANSHHACKVLAQVLTKRQGAST